MTLLVGVSDRKRVWIGADSGSVSEEFATVAAEPKSFERDGWLIACAGDWRAMELIRYESRLPNVPSATDLHRVVCIEFSRAIETAFSENGYDLEKDNDLMMLIGVGNSLFYWEANHAERVPYYAVGIGDELALGFLEAKHGEVEPSELIQQAMKATRKYYGAIRPPYRVANT